MSAETTEVGMIVEWLGSPYTIVSKNKKGVLLKQNFSIGIVLNSEVPYEEVSLVRSA
jgi:hypothetical protein